MSQPTRYFHAATSFELASWRYLFRFLRYSDNVQKAMRRTPGFLKSSLRPDLFRATFKTYTVFESYEALQDLVHSPEHLRAMASAADWSGPESRTASWSSESGEIDWAEGRRRLAGAVPFLQKRQAARSNAQAT